MGNYCSEYQTVLELNYEDYKIDTNFVSWKKSNYTDDIIIKCHPKPKNAHTECYFILKSDNKRFVEFYNKLNSEKSWRISYKHFSTEPMGFMETIIFYEIINIQECQERELIMLIKDFLNISIEDKNLINYSQLITPADNIYNIRILITNNEIENIITGQAYSIKFRKFYKSNFYLVSNINKLAS